MIKCTECLGRKKHACMALYSDGHVAELVYAYASGAYVARLGGSSPLMPTSYKVTGRMQ